VARGRGEDFAELDAAEDSNGREDGEQEPEVADAVDDERFAARRRAPLLFVVVADQEVRTEADAFPTDEEHGKV
jgi:hypothetical protein